MINLIIYLILGAILVALGTALYSLLKVPSEKADPARTAKALRIRIGLSIFLFLFLFFAFLMGWIKPHGINPVASPVLQPIDKNK
jgi:O-antigen/teichoic acid export membrane protein